MSRIGRRPVPIASGVEVKVDAGMIRVKGPKGQLEHFVVPGTSVEVKGGEALVSRADDEKKTKSAHGLMRALLANMVTGVTAGFEKQLDIQGVGYRAEASGGKLTLTIGYTHPVVFQVPKGLEVATPSPTRVVVRGSDRQRVGQLAAEIRAVRPPDPYKGKGIRYVGERVRKKVGKSGATGGGGA
jgi:large subunit ribosomal protein L6